MTAFSIPHNAEARLCMRPGLPTPYLVAVAIPPAVPDPDDIMRRRGCLSAVLTHDAGLSWPDRRGATLAEAVLAKGGGAVLGFVRLADALACHKRLTEGRA